MRAGSEGDLGPCEFPAEPALVPPRPAVERRAWFSRTRCRGFGGPARAQSGRGLGCPRLRAFSIHAPAPFISSTDP